MPLRLLLSRPFLSMECMRLKSISLSRLVIFEGRDLGDNDKSSVVSRAYVFRETSFGDVAEATRL
jgi:hypothetical protein